MQSTGQTSMHESSLMQLPAMTYVMPTGYGTPRTHPAGRHSSVDVRQAVVRLARIVALAALLAAACCQPASAAGTGCHRLRLTLATAVSHLQPTAAQLPGLAGGA